MRVVLRTVRIAAAQQLLALVAAPPDPHFTSIGSPPMTLTDLIARVEGASGADREIDGRVMFSLFAKPMCGRGYLWPEDNPCWSFAFRFDQSMRAARTAHDETIEWQQSDGSWILMNSLRVPPLTASIDAVVALIRRTPRAEYSVAGTEDYAEAHVNFPVDPAVEDGDYFEGSTGSKCYPPALALLLAFLRAYQARAAAA